MSEVRLEIGGRTYPVACADGEEEHVMKLGDMIDEKVRSLGDARTPQEVQNFLFASLILADELKQAQQDAAEAEAASETDAPKPGGKKSELRAEIEELRKAKARIAEERDVLAKQLEEAKAKVDEAEKASKKENQHDLFGEDVLATRLEALASRAESFAEALEGDASPS